MERKAFTRAWRFLDYKPVAKWTAVTAAVEIPEMDTMGARWDRYVADQDLTGLDRDRVRELGHRYLGQAVEQAGG